MNQRIAFPARMRRLRTLPVLPTLLTAGNLACGVSAILAAADERLFLGAILLCAAMLCDMLDGKVARMTGTEGAFGAELDSLADVVSFGVAPALLVHRLVLESPGLFQPGERLIYLVTIFYAVMAAIRLARYNVEHDNATATKHFRGLPSPGAAAVVVAWIVAWSEVVAPLTAHQGDGQANAAWIYAFKSVLMGVVVLCGLLMVSNIPFPHLGNTVLGRRMGFRRAMLLLAALFCMAWQPVWALLVLANGYLLVGLIPGILRAVRAWRHGHDLLDDEDDEEDPQAQDDPAQAVVR